MIGRALAGEAWNLPFYVEMAYPDICDKDTRTPQEVKADILGKLTGAYPGGEQGSKETDDADTGIIREADS